MLTDTPVMFAQFVGDNSIRALVESEFFAYALPFLFIFAVMYGLLSQGGIIKNKPSQVVISLVAGFLVLPIAPSLIGIMSTLSSSVVIAIGAFLVLIVMFELLGLKGEKVIQKGDKEGVGWKAIGGNMFQVHHRIFLALIAFIVILIFANAGGFSAVGLPTPSFLFNSPLVFFIIFIIAIVTWVSSRG